MGHSSGCSASFLPAFNILPLEHPKSSSSCPKWAMSYDDEYAALNYREVQAAIKLLRSVGDTMAQSYSPRYLKRKMENMEKMEEPDILDWLRALFGFQDDNVRNQREHVVLLLANHQMRSQPPHSSIALPIDDSHSDSIKWLHHSLLKNYKLWCSFLHVQHPWYYSEDDQPELLTYSCLFLLIWGEAANLRFMPECLCYIFYHMVQELHQLWQTAVIPGADEELTEGVENDNEEKRPLSFSDQPDELSFLEKVIRPIYETAQAEANYGSGMVPHSKWRNYDDMNEFFWSCRCFDKTEYSSERAWICKLRKYLMKPPTKPDTGSRVAREQQTIGLQPSSPSHSLREQQTIELQPRSRSHSLQQPRSSNSTSGAAKSCKDAHLNTRGGTMGFKVGFVEQRSFWNIYNSFDRLWIAQILGLQALITIAFSGDFQPWYSQPWQVLSQRDNQVRLLYIFVTWAALRSVKALLDAIMQFPLISRSTAMLALRMALKIMVAMAWIAIFTILISNMREQRARDRRWSDAANQKLFQVLEAAAVFLVPELLIFVLYFLPCIANCVEMSDAKVFEFLDWWFHSRMFVGRGLHQSCIETFKYTLFWIILLFFKFTFSYFLQVRPLVDATRELLSLTIINQEWHEFFSNHNRFIVAVLWTPVLLVYFMDIEIWYSMFSSVVGALIGLYSRIGEIRTMHQFRLRFPFFASAVTFTLLPDNEPDQQRTSSKFRNMITRLKNAYGFGKHYVKLMKSPQAKMFACIWNSILLFLREEDYLNDEEKELLEMPHLSRSFVKGILEKEGVIPWPCVLLSNEVSVALKLAGKQKGTDTRKLWRKIREDDYRESAVKEGYFGLKHLLLDQLIDRNQEGRTLLKRLIEQIEESCRHHKFLEWYQAKKLKEVCKRAVDLLDVLLNVGKQLEEVQNAVFNLIDVLLTDLPKADLPKSSELLKEPEDVRSQKETSELLKGLEDVRSQKETIKKAVQLPAPDDADFYHYVIRLRHILNTKDPKTNVPENLEAKRRIAFFSNSLFMNMPPAPNVDKMRAFSVLTPYYNEHVRYSLAEVNNIEEGITIKFYLQTIFPDEWKNFEERVQRLGKKKLQDGESKASKDPKSNLKDEELRLWASYRGQTLSRTVRGMMYYQRALEMLAHLEQLGQKSKQDEQASTDQEVLGHDISQLNLTAQHRAAALLKFTYVMSCQIYGAQKKDATSTKHTDIHWLMQRYPTALRVAYVDDKVAHVGEEGESYQKIKYYSVLVKHDRVKGEEVEIYRIELPGPFKLGEGKPENQNHAIIFTRGEALQTIDMNQDNYFEEALKVRNLLEEFSFKYGKVRPTILGIREHIFTGSVSSLGSFMSAQETSFVTLGQRVLANPLKIRMHYGHPDMFDRLWFLPRGGISKASKTINVSEDIFAGFNCTLRRGNVTHHEYIQVGKGRDVGLNQISAFEAKVSGGNGEQMLSRDVYRLGHRLDFFRTYSFYHTTVGFYLGNLIIVLTVYAFVWGRVYLALSGIEQYIESTSNNPGLMSVLNQQFIVQVGLFTALPMVVENSLEHGVSVALWGFLMMQLQLCSVFYTFLLGTKAHYFGRTILHGGAKYRGTGRGFVVKREKFSQNYRIYARSHFVKAIELIILLIIYEVYGKSNRKHTMVYVLLTLSSWFLALSWMMAPFLFNPSGFDWLRTVEDFEEFQAWLWLRRGPGTQADKSWEVWWNEEMDHLTMTGFWGKVMEAMMSLRFFLIQYGMVYRLDIAAHNKSILVYLVSWIVIVVAAVVYIVVERARQRYAAKQHRHYRGLQLFVVLFLAMVMALLVALTNFKFRDLLLSLLAFLPTGWGILCVAQVMKEQLMKTQEVWGVVQEVARLYEFVMAMMVMLPVAILSWMPGFQAMQTRILFNQAFSRGLEISRILSARPPSSSSSSSRAS